MPSDILKRLNATWPHANLSPAEIARASLPANASVWSLRQCQGHNLRRLKRIASPGVNPRGNGHKAESIGRECRASRSERLCEETGDGRNQLIWWRARRWAALRSAPHDLVGKIWGWKYRGQQQQWGLDAVSRCSMPIFRIDGEQP